MILPNIEDEETGEVVPGYIGPKAVRIAPRDIVFNPLATTFKDSWNITRSVKGWWGPTSCRWNAGDGNVMRSWNLLKWTGCGTLTTGRIRTAAVPSAEPSTTV